MKKNRIRYAHSQNKEKSSWTDDRDAKPQRALRIHWNNREHGKSKLGFPNANANKKKIPKIITICTLTVFNIAIPVLVEFNEGLL